MVLQLDGDKLSLAAFEALLLHVQASDTEYPDGFCNEIRLGLSLPKRQAAIVIKNIDVQSAALPKHEDPRFSMQVTVFHCLSPSFHCVSPRILLLAEPRDHPDVPALPVVPKCQRPFMDHCHPAHHRCLHAPVYGLMPPGPHE